MEGDDDSWLKANCTKDDVVVDFGNNEKAKQRLAGEECWQNVLILKNWFIC